MRVQVPPPDHHDDGATITKRTLAICLVFIIGALCGTVLGFIVTVWRSNEVSMVPEAFPYWLQDPFGLNWWPWPLFGGTIAALVYLAHLLGAGADTETRR